MRFSTFIATLAAASFVSAGVIPKRQITFPNCAMNCLINADIGSCTTNTCLCENDVYLRNTTNCIQNGCSAADLALATTAARAVCTSAGVDISTNPAAQPTAAA